MSALLHEIVTYGIKFLAMLVCAGLGIMAGKKIRQNKNNKQASNE